MAEGQLAVFWSREFEPLISERLEQVRLPKKYAEAQDSIVGLAVDRFETRGKHMLLNLSDGRVIHCHALMFGSWQIGPAPLELRKPEKQIRLRLVTATHEAVFYNGPIVELIPEGGLDDHPRLSRLGPDILASDFDRDEAWRRLISQPDTPIADAILDQEVVAGIGNIYKSEGLFLAGIDPRRTVSDIPRAQVEELWDTTAELMWLGVEDRGRTHTLPSELRQGRDRNWVYQRRGRPCFKCEDTVQMIRQGPHERKTYFCATCQR